MKHLRLPVRPSVPGRLRRCLAIGLGWLLFIFLDAPPSVAAPSQQPAAPTSSPGELLDVSADSPSDAWAVGANPTETTAFAMHWDGTAWSTVPVQLPGGIDSQLVAVKAISPTDVWAVGWYKNHQHHDMTLTEHWDGTAFSIVSSPNPGARSNVLRDVEATGPEDVWAVGATNIRSGQKARAIVEHWDGASWQLVTTTHLRQGLSAVSAVAPDGVWVAGLDLSRWNGSTWTRIWRNPGGSEEIAYLSSVQGVSASDAWVVGQHYEPSMFVAQAQDGQLINQRYSCDYSGFGDIEVLADNDVWAVGGCYNDATGTVRAEIVHWDGSKWKRFTNPIHGSLVGIEASSSSDIWAVGGTDHNTTLVEHYNGSNWTVVPS